MNVLAHDLEGVPDFPTFEAQWAPVYLEPIVESGERLTIGVVAGANGNVSGSLTITDKALECLYGASSDGMKSMMELALKKAMAYAKNGFVKGYSSGIHGVVLGEAREGIGYDLDDIISQGIALCSSLSQVHSEDAKSAHDRSSYWRRVQKAMERVDKNLVQHFNVPVDVTIRGSRLSLQCDYFSSRIAVNVCSLSTNYRLSHLFDAATSKVFRLEQLKNHDALIKHDHKAAMMLVLPQDATVELLKPAALKNYKERILLLQDMAEKKDFDLVTVHSAFEGAKEIQKLEKTAA
ncbi:hypothetical protein [Pseudomonas sp. FP2300]|uniref:hypothetical protein n=1 Tax=Pseudomonas sp. FP2300 TaxID=2954090 RepID=UPI0027369714|nr:hypothetical protein [Pseudomonas sp. FP2300]WLH61046.1 hypothetical protein PSH86_20180 [Pseudomonas sp. FP2300]